MVKEEKSKVDSGTKPKIRRFQKSTSTRKVTFKETSYGLKDKVFGVGKQRHGKEFVNNRKEISK